MEENCEECEWGILKMLLCFDVWIHILEKMLMSLLRCENDDDIINHFLKEKEKKEE